MFERTDLPEGPRVISARLPGTRSLSIAAYVLAGSRHERRELSGVAHFMEHLTFKGTQAYPTTRAVSSAIEGVGGTSNAATDRESTVYWVRLPAREAERAVGMLGELMVRPLLRDEDIAKEREIIVEEIRSYHDDASSYVYNVFDEAFFGDSPLGWEIAGDEDSVRGLPADAIRAFWAQAYRPANIVVALAGDIDHPRAVDLVRAAFGTGNGVVPGWQPAPSVPVERFRLAHREGAQAHMVLGMPALPRDDPEQWTLELLNTVLGDGSSCRLFLCLREDEALAYDVHSFPVDYADCGVLEIYAGVDPDDLAPALEALLRELAAVRDERISQEELDKARNYAVGRLELRMEESRNVASWLGVQEALHERVLDVDEVIEQLQAVTPARIQALAQRLIRDDALTLAVVAPPGAGGGLDEALRLP
ncbi:MAG TPA: pitrilysin family protein [Candidatus Limnocylindrales bacterium]|nr:pitrilysin family protein [Candidatus Limnocylindrales bacterium]